MTELEQLKSEIRVLKRDLHKCWCKRREYNAEILRLRALLEKAAAAGKVDAPGKGDEYFFP